MESKIEKEAKETISNIVSKAKKEAYEIIMPELESLRTELEMIKEDKVNSRNPSPFFQEMKSFYKEFSEEGISEAAFTFGGGGSNYIAEADRIHLTKSSRFRSEVSPFIKNIKDILRASVTNRTIKIDIPSDKIDTLINDILKKNKIYKRLKGWVENCYIDSECFIRLYLEEKGDFKLRETDSLEIREILYDEDDVEDIVGFERRYDTTEGEGVRYYRNGLNEESYSIDDKISFEENTIMFYFRYGYRPGRRGESQLLPILRWDRIYEDILLDLARLYHERAKVVWIKTIKGNDNNATSTTTRPYASSVFRVETDTIKWRIEDPNLADFNDQQYGRVHRLAIAAGVNMPEAYVFSDSSKTAYASLRKADTPFSLLVDDTQAMWSENIKEMVRVIIRELIRLKKIPKTTKIKRIPQSKFVEALSLAQGLNDDPKNERLNEALDNFDPQEEEVRINTEDIPVSVFFPKRNTENPLQTAQSLEVLRRAGVISQRTAIKMAGEDPELEMAMMKYDVTPIAIQTVDNKAKNVNQTRSQTPQDNYDKKLNKGTS